MYAAINMNSRELSSREATFLDKWTRFFSELQSFLRTIENTHRPNNDFSEYVLSKLEMWITAVSQLIDYVSALNTSQVIEQYTGLLDSLLSHLRRYLREWNDRITDRESQRGFAYCVPTSPSPIGRPRFFIAKEQLEYLRSMSFKWVQIANLLGVSYVTTYRRRIEFGMTGESRGRSLDDNSLIRNIDEMRRDQPSLGQTMIWARLRSQGFYVTRARVRESIRITDPLNNALRWKGMTPRRPYSVPSPNSLWHLDGQHKLIRWRMVVHAAIDGFSRTVVFIRCSTNNRAATVYEHFLKAVGNYGLPSRIRVDQGGENVLVARHMLRHRGVSRNSVLVGSSVHNQRIERLWRDSHRCATSIYYRLFYYMEENEMLDPLDEEHLFALHYVFLAKINKSLEVFQSTWNNHGLRTEHGQTPQQLFMAGVLKLRQSGLTAVDFFDRVDEYYGSQGDDDSFGIIDDYEGVPVPDSYISPTQDQLSELRLQVDPFASTEDYGVSLFNRTLEIVHSWSQSPMH